MIRELYNIAYLLVDPSLDKGCLGILSVDIPNNLQEKNYTTFS